MGLLKWSWLINYAVWNDEIIIVSPNKMVFDTNGVMITYKFNI